MFAATARAPNIEDYVLGLTDSEQDVEAERSHQMVPRKVQRQLRREIPYELIPAAHRHLYEKDMDREWSDWLRWKSVVVLDPDESSRIDEDPVLRRRIIDSRFCYRHKDTGKDPEVLRKLGELPVRAEARLVIQGFKDPDRRRLRKDSPTASRQAVQVLLQVVTSLGWDL